LIQGHKVKVIDEYYSSTQTQELMAKCHVLLSLHKSEGFGLTLAESLAVKTPVVCTGYSGNTDFVKNKSFLVDYTLRPTHHNHFKGEWAKPNIDSAVYKLQTIISDYPEIEIEEGYNFIKDNLNIPVISDKMKTLLETI
jgi:glycosyltransferase involved in cell wall biosynthesis